MKNLIKTFTDQNTDTGYGIRYRSGRKQINRPTLTPKMKPPEIVPQRQSTEANWNVSVKTHNINK